MWYQNFKHFVLCCDTETTGLERRAKSPLLWGDDASMYTYRAETKLKLELKAQKTGWLVHNPLPADNFRT